MIDESIVAYLASVPAIASLVPSKVFYVRAAVTAKMPWVCVLNSGGMPKKLTQGDNGYTEFDDTLTIYVDSENQFAGKRIVDAVFRALHNYRGDMGSVQDSFIRCGTPRPYEGWGTSYRYILPVYAKYRLNTTVPV